MSAVPVIDQTPIQFSFFRNKFDSTPVLNLKKWHELVAWYSKPKEFVDENDRNSNARLICPSVFKQGAIRNASGVDFVTMATLDMDKGHDMAQFIEEWSLKGLEFVVHTSFNHSEEYPKWRAIFPLKTPVNGSDWAKVWRLFTDDMSHSLSDPACKDACRMYFVPCVPVGMTEAYRFHHNAGEWLDPKPYVEAVSVVEARETQERKHLDEDSPGNWLEMHVPISQILEPHGWVMTGESGGMEHWRRPGKETGTSATWGMRPEYSGDRFYCFSSSTDLPPNRSLSKFALYAELNHRGDFAAAAKGIAERYGLEKKRFVEEVNEPEVIQGSMFDGITLDKADPNIRMEFGICGLYIPRGELTLIEGWGESGKTSLCIGIAANGSNGFDRVTQTPMSKFRSLYIGEEQNASQGRRRFDQFKGNPEYFEWTEKAFDLTSKTLTSLAKKLERDDIKWVTLDPIWEFMPAYVRENSRRDVQKWLTELQDVAQSTGVAIGMINHFAKYPSGKMLTELGHMNAPLLTRSRSHLAVFMNPENKRNRVVIHGRGNTDTEQQLPFGFGWNSMGTIDWYVPGGVDTQFVDDLLKPKKK